MYIKIVRNGSSILNDTCFIKLILIWEGEGEQQLFYFLIPKIGECMFKCANISGYIESENSFSCWTILS